jgi:hypothetical protein
MTLSHGSKAIFKLDSTSGGTVADISAYLSNITFSPTADTADSTTLGNTHKQYVLGMQDAAIKIEGKFDPVTDAIFGAMLGEAVTRSWEYGPQGTTNGLVKYTGECICTSYEISTPVGDVGAFTAQLQVSGTVGHSTW